jgi:ribonuclease HI
VDDEHWAAGGWPRATNNQGELTAVLELFRATAHLDDDLLVLCDSQYVINSVTKWMPGWKAKGWRKGDGKPVLNVELMQQIDEAIAGRRYRFEWVKGHVGHELNEAADTRARGAAEAYQRRTEVPSGPGWPGAAAPAPASGPSAAAIAADAPRAAAVEAEPETDDAPELSLFELDEPDLVDVTVTLTPEEHARLVERARRLGVAPAEALRSLI